MGNRHVPIQPPFTFDLSSYTRDASFSGGPLKNVTISRSAGMGSYETLHSCDGAIAFCSTFIDRGHHALSVAKHLSVNEKTKINTHTNTPYFLTVLFLSVAGSSKANFGSASFLLKPNFEKKMKSRRKKKLSTKKMYEYRPRPCAAMSPFLSFYFITCCQVTVEKNFYFCSNPNIKSTKQRVSERKFASHGSIGSTS